MRRQRRRQRQARSGRKRLLLGLLIVLTVCSAVYAFTAAITVPASSAGDGNAAISSVGSIATMKYTLDSSTPTKIQDVTLTFNNPQPSIVQAQIGSGSWSGNCSNSGGTFTCTWSSEPSVAATNLRVVATG
jgi:hypothetical protein